MGFLEQADGADLLVTFVVGFLVGFSFVVADSMVLSKVETALSIPAGTF